MLIFLAISLGISTPLYFHWNFKSSPTASTSNFVVFPTITAVSLGLFIIFTGDRTITSYSTSLDPTLLVTTNFHFPASSISIILLILEPFLSDCEIFFNLPSWYHSTFKGGVPVNEAEISP